MEALIGIVVLLFVGVLLTVFLIYLMRAVMKATDRLEEEDE